MSLYLKSFLVAAGTTVAMGAAAAEPAAVTPDEPVSMRFTDQCNAMKNRPDARVFEKARKPEVYVQNDRVGCRFGLNGAFRNLLEVYPLHVPARAQEFHKDMEQTRAAHESATPGTDKTSIAPVPAPRTAQEIVAASRERREQRRLESRRRYEEKHGISP